MLIAGQADIAVLLDFRKPTNEFELLEEEEVALSFFAAIDSPLTSRMISAEVLKNQMFALTEENCKYRKIAETILRKIKLSLNHAHRCNFIFLPVHIAKGIPSALPLEYLLPAFLLN